MMKSITLVAVLAITIALPFAPASAAETRSVKVVHQDLNLNRQAGRAVLESRINRAIVSVCGRVTDDRLLARTIRKCQVAAREAANKSRDRLVANYGATKLVQGADGVRIASK